MDRIYHFFTYTALGSLFFFGLGLSNIENYINWLLFPIVCIIAGAIFGVIIFQILKLKYPKISTFKYKDRSGILMPICFTFSLTFFGLGARVNEAYISDKNCKIYQIQDKGESNSKMRSHYVFVNLKGKTTRLEIHKNIYNKYAVGDNIQLCINTGYFGFKFITYSK